MANYYAELAISSPAVAKTTASIHSCHYPVRDGQAEWVPLQVINPSTKCQTPCNRQMDMPLRPIVRGQTETRNRIWCILALKCDIRWQ